jgi:hypothetical protein
MKNVLKYALLISTLLLSAGCVTQTRTIYVPVKVDGSKQTTATENTVYVVREVPVIYQPPHVYWRMGVGVGRHRHYPYRGPWYRW